MSKLRVPAALVVSLVTLASAVSASAALAGDAQPAHSDYVDPVQVVGVEDGSGNPALLSGATRLAVDQARHTLLVADSGHNRVAVYATGPGAATFQQEIGVGTLSAPFGLAYDVTDNLLYVSDAGNNRIVRYVVSGTSPATYTLDPTYTSPSLGTGPGQIGSFAAALAVDPRNGDLLVADPGNHRVTRFSASGPSSFDGSDTSSGTFTSPTDIAVGADGTVYVTDVSGNPVFGSSRLEKFTPTGVSLGRLDTVAAANPAAIDLATAVSVNPTDGMVLSGVSDPTTGYPGLAGAIGPDPGGVATLASDYYTPALGVGVDAGALGQAYLLDTNGVWAFSAILAPGVSVDAPGAITATTATLSGSIDTGGAAGTTARFEYSTDGFSYTAAPDVTPAPSSGTTQTLTGLAPNQTYTARLVATGADGAVTTSRLLTFTTQPSRPGVLTLVAHDVNTTQASLIGSVTPEGSQTTYHFEYGPTDQYGSTAPAGSEETAGAQRTARVVTVGVEGLQPNTVYHYRLVARDVAGTSYGQDQTLVTDALGLPERGYEQVTPVQKDGAILNESDGFKAAIDGDSAMFQTLGTIISTEPQSDPIGSRTISRRTSTGWVARSVDPPYSVVSGTAHAYATIAFSPDLSQALSISNQALAPGAIAGQGNVYIENTATRALRLLEIVSPSEFDNKGYGAGNPYEGGSPDWSHLFVGIPQPLSSDAPSSGGVYDAGGASPVLISRDAGGNPATGISGFEASSDGQTIAYATSDGALAVVRGGVFRYISISQRPGDPSTPEPAGAHTLSSDGSELFFVDASGTPLTTDAPAGPGDLYRWSASAPPGRQLEYVGVTSTGQISAVSSDGNAVFYPTAGGFTAWRAGIGSQLLSTTYSGVSGRMQVSPDGRYLADVVGEQLTSDPIVSEAGCGPTPTNPAGDGRCRELYLFDLDAHSLVCASCAADLPPAGDVLTGLTNSDGSVASFLTPDGGVFFSTSLPLNRGDVNGDLDVYEYRAGQTHLISRGRPGTRSVFAGATSSGSDVFFQTNDQLVSQDTDSAADLYDARIDGGIPAQNPTPAVVPCVGDECRQSPTGPAQPGALASQGSPASPAPLNPLARTVARARVSVARATVSGTALRVTVKATAAGRLRISGKYLTTQVKRVGQSGTFTLTVKLTSAARRLYAHHRQLSVGVRVSLTPPSGRAAVATASRTLHR